MSEKQRSCGALWQKQGKTGVYMTGIIELEGKQVKIIVFPNGYKKEEKHPDWRVFLSIPRDETPQEILPNEEPF